MVNVLTQRITNQIGEKHIEDVVFTRQQTYGESTSTMALFFILSPGADPVNNLEILRETSSSLRDQGHNNSTAAHLLTRVASPINP
jgi:hypothetical protein